MISAPAHDLAQAVLTVDLDALQSNWRSLRDFISPAACAAVIKADAYGVGLERATAALSKAGCNCFFTAHIDEGLRARAALDHLGADGRIFVLNGLSSSAPAAQACADAGLIPMIGTREDSELWLGQAKASSRQLPVALMFDTGMNRLGFGWRDAAALATWFNARGDINPILIASHFVSSDAPGDARNAEQIARFQAVRRYFPRTPASLANSSGVFLDQRPFFDLVRPGYALYGGNPSPNRDNPMQPVVHVRARILQLRDVEAGESVGYDAQWTARRPTRLAAIGVGYADGLPRNAMATDDKRGGEALVAGRRCSFAGRISMDITMIDVTDVPSDSLASDPSVELLGADITIDELGARAQTIGYEILTGLGRRYFREYRGG